MMALGNLVIVASRFRIDPIPDNCPPQVVAGIPSYAGEDTGPGHHTQIFCEHCGYAFQYGYIIYWRRARMACYIRRWSPIHGSRSIWVEGCDAVLGHWWVPLHRGCTVAYLAPIAGA